MPESYLNEGYLELYQKYDHCFNSTKFLYDRSGNTPHYLKIDPNAHPIPKDYKGFNLTFNEVAEKRCKELLALGKPINVSWSGGLDSTFVLFSLYHYATDKSQIKVYGTYNSIIESGDLFDKYIKDKFNFDIHVNTEYKNNYRNKPDEIFVTGGNGNSIFYQDCDYHPPDSWMRFKQDGSKSEAIKYLADKHYSYGLRDYNLEFLHNTIINSPRKIETLQDLRWLVQFNFNWNTANINSYIGIGTERSKTVHTFFASEDFQKWSITNNDPPTKTGDYSDERWQQREWLTEVFGISSYAKHKKNYTSVLSSIDTDWVFILNDYSNVYISDL